MDSDCSGHLSEIFVSFQGEGLHAGRRQLFVRFAGCHLRCRYCDEPGSLVAGLTYRVIYPDGIRERPNPLGPAELAGEVGALAALSPRLHAVALTGGEPLLQAGFIARWLGAHPLSLPVLLETSATLPDRLATVLPAVAIVSLDLKLPSNTGEHGLWEEQEACLRLACVKDGGPGATGDGGRREGVPGCRRAREVYVKMPLDDETEAAEVERGARLVAAVDRDLPLFLQPLAAAGEARLLVSPARLERFHALASRHCSDVRILPQVHKLLGVP